MNTTIARRLPGFFVPAASQPVIVDCTCPKCGGESAGVSDAEGTVPLECRDCFHKGLYGTGTNESLAERQQRFLAMKDGYQPGAIICCSWGWEQTNINFYRIEKRSGAFVTLIPLRQTDRKETQFMAGTCMPSDTTKDYRTDHDPVWPNKDLANPKPTFRRKLCMRDGVVNGINVFGCGWAKLWSGTPTSWSSYA